MLLSDTYRNIASKNSKREPLKFSTQCVHAGQSPDRETGAISPPIHQSTTFAQKAPGEPEAYSYSRGANPTRSILEANVAALEGASGSAAFASGMAAIAALIHCLPQKSRVICPKSLYGGTHRLFEKIYRPQGHCFEYVDTTDLPSLSRALATKTDLLFMETPSNPLLHVSDIAKACNLAHEAGAKVAVDNTFMTPRFQRPLELGADYVIHSGTKFFGGHSDVLIGFVVPRCSEDLEALRFYQKAAGAVPSPMESWLCLRGLKTLSLRMERQCNSAKVLAEFLVHHPMVEKVFYPGLSSHPGYDTQMTQAQGSGGAVVTFELAEPKTRQGFLDTLSLFTLAESLGAVESLVSIPSKMSHGSLSAEERTRMGIHEGLVRLSIGIEDPDDLQEALRSALDSVAA